MQKPIRDILTKEFSYGKQWFFANEWQHIPQNIKDAIKANTESTNNSHSYYIALWEVWRYASCYYTIYGLTGLQEFINETLRIY